MLVSFIIIAYNAEKFLDKSLESLKKQDYPHKDIEVILVDSISTDGTRKVFEEFKKENEKDFYQIKILTNKGKTLPKGWNVALKEVTGEVVLRVDAHTFFDKDFIWNNVKEIENGENIVGGKCISVTQNNDWKEKLLLIAEESIFGCGIADFRRKESKEYVSTLAFAMYRKKVFDDVGPYNENLARTEDNEMHYRIRKAGYKICFNPDIISYQNIRNSWCGMLKQKYGNGHWIGLTLGVCPGCFSIHHFVPLAFVFALILTGIIALLGNTGMLVCLCILYVIVDLLMSVLAVQRQKWYNYYLMLPLIFLSLHLAYGVGTLIGIIEMPFWVRKIKRDKNE